MREEWWFQRQILIASVRGRGSVGFQGINLSLAGCVRGIAPFFSTAVRGVQPAEPGPQRLPRRPTTVLNNCVEQLVTSTRPNAPRSHMCRTPHLAPHHRTLTPTLCPLLTTPRQLHPPP